jgi:hypothetical protein
MQVARVHGLVSSEHAAPSAATASLGQVVLPPQVSTGSHSPVLGRQTVLAGAAVWAQTAPTQASTVQTLPSSSQGCPLRVTSAGQAPLPSQYSSTSQGPAESRHTVVLGRAVQVPGVTAQESHAPPLHAVPQHTPSTQYPLEHCPGSAHEVPSVSLGRQIPALQYWPAVQVIVAQSAQATPTQVPGQVSVWVSGQAGPWPEQLAASVATPEAQEGARHSLVAGRNASGGHELSVPLQVSSMSQSPLTGRHGVPTWTLASVQAVEVPLQVSSASHGPVGARQGAPAFPAT